MNQQELLMMLPGMQPDELIFVQTLTEDMSEKQMSQFVLLYAARRKEYTTMLICTLIGFFGVAGIQRFVLGEIGMGILYIFTGGLCCIGTIVDLINIRDMTFRYNKKQATEAATMAMMVK
ncbi:MAG: rane protein [Bacteroidetes bacterium]|nr:rane protein [Bacteroidota bacterium]